MAKNVLGRSKSHQLFSRLNSSRSIESETDLEYVMNLSARASLQYMAEMTAERLYDYTISDFYGERSPTHYDRTFELLDSITISAQEGSTQSVYFDTRKIHGHFPVKGMWAQHRSMPTQSANSMNMSEAIPYWAEEGNDGGIYEYNGGHMIQNTINDIEEIFASLSSELRDNGLSLSL